MQILLSQNAAAIPKNACCPRSSAAALRVDILQSHNQKRYYNNVGGYWEISNVREGEKRGSASAVFLSQPDFTSGILSFLQTNLIMALPLPPGLTPPETAFLCEMELVTVVPRQRLEGLQLLGVSEPALPNYRR